MVAEVRVSVSPGYIYFHGTTTLPDGTVLVSDLYEDGEILPWWPTQQSILVDSGAWEMKVPLGVNGAPSDLKIGPWYLFKVWRQDDPSVLGQFGFDFVGPPPPGPDGANP